MIINIKIFYFGHIYMFEFGPRFRHYNSGFIEFQKIWIPMGTGYQREKKCGYRWVPGTGRIKNCGYRWVPGTSQKKFFGYRWVPGTGQKKNFGYRWVPGTEQIL